MPLKWHLFRIICVLQILCALYLIMQGLVALLNQGSFMAAFTIIAMLIISALGAMGISLLNKNFPSIPVEGKQKKNFNRLFLLNILLLALLFAQVFSAFYSLRALASYSTLPWYQFPFWLTYPFYLSLFMLLAQFVILYGLYVLRNELYQTFANKRFEFEDKRKD